ncbi:hypothetical protein PML78_01335 [Enterococcus dispar]|uniref:hypothetical protein n=1 Tax=Enterococcus dispar TaxID=44009 RepID=UPI00232DE513|nr:hypothetical protein [Enterococcus dispar]WCG33358.1 hypothetical protein PML78_01335 [Enterococcus dispar]
MFKILSTTYAMKVIKFVEKVQYNRIYRILWFADTFTNKEYQMTIDRRITVPDLKTNDLILISFKLVKYGKKTHIKIAAITKIKK